MIAIATLLAFTVARPAVAQERTEIGDNSNGEEIVVQATRSGSSADKEPIRVEVLDREEIEEKLMMTPGNIAMLVSETPGIRTQITSPSLGSADIRMQGLKGRYTQLLADGLPLYGGQLPAVGLLQIPPTDLGQVEIIKGAASALYGPSALGGVINLVSRRPSAVPEADILLNATSLGGQDATIYATTPVGDGWNVSLTGGYSRQDRQDLNHDGWADIPGYDRWTIRPRLFWTGASGAKIMLTVGGMTEQREGGTLPGDFAPGGQPFPQTLDSKRLDGGIVADIPLAPGTLHIRASGMTQNDDHRYGTTIEDDHRRSFFAETSYTTKSGPTSWLAGAAFQADLFRSPQFSSFNYSYTAPALFGQVEQILMDRLTLASSLRWDAHSEYGSRISPRLSLLYHPERWTIRASLGRGFYAPTPFVEEIEEAGLSRLKPLGRLKAETANTASVDVGFKAGSIQANFTLFGSNISHAVQLVDDGVDRVKLANANGLTRTRGAELLLRYRWQDFSITGSYVYVDATEPDPNGPNRRLVPLTPRHSGGLVGTWEKEGKGKIGLEAYYTGRQSLENNPYRSHGKPYFQIGAMAELILGRISLFINAEDLLDIRQTKYDPLLLPGRAPDGAWTVDAWAPLEGRVVNGGIRVHFGGHD
ncbi:TonB-dependent receptor [Blastomonas sp. CCH13-E1]|uniref:TonB-dependent receptor plug domain-containing protein n=1 Tax=Blastomonas sp. CCH13-E1 TaxID=1768739 RepID=UPI00082500F5|nr:TonB-dependent receptor [Blastomonas sp. CCH13-E1]